MLSGMSTGIGTDLSSGIVGASIKAQDAASSALSHAEMREDTAIQRAVADMKSAGINPILGFNGAGAASSAASSANVSAQAQLKAQKIAGIFSIISSAMSLASLGLFRPSSAYQGTHFGFYN